MFNPLNATGGNMHQTPMLIEMSGIERVKWYYGPAGWAVGTRLQIMTFIG